MAHPQRQSQSTPPETRGESLPEDDADGVPEAEERNKQEEAGQRGIFGHFVEDMKRVFDWAQPTNQEVIARIDAFEKLFNAETAKTREAIRADWHHTEERARATIKEIRDINEKMRADGIATREVIRAELQKTRTHITQELARIGTITAQCVLSVLTAPAPTLPALLLLPIMLQVGEHQSPKTETETETDTAAAAAAAPTANASTADDAVNNLEESTERRTSLPANNHSNDAVTATLNANDARTADTSRSTTSLTSNHNHNLNNHNHASSSITHSTTARSNTPSRPPVAKDKRCIYCHMAFTSSALGRHYDQFLFKKKPDGVHNVDEICQMRSNITRRTARTSSAAAELTKQEPAFSNASVSDAGSVRSARPAQSLPPVSSSAAAASASAGPDGIVPVADQHRQSVGRPSGVGAYQVYYNPSPFTNTSPLVNTNNHSTNNNNSNNISNSPVPPKLPQTDTNSKTHTMRAMELALREVLDSIKAATTRVHARVLPFDFELNTQTYPSLCLNALQPPPTIFSPGPFPSDTSFSIEPPTAALKERVQTALRERVDKWKHDQLAALDATSDKSTPPQVIKFHAEMDLIERQARQHEEMVLKHLDLAIKYWETASPEEQRRQWHLEILRALAREVSKRRDLESQLDRAYQESDRLRLQLERAHSFHFPREFAFFPPDMMPVPAAIARELGGGGGNGDGAHPYTADSPRWDYDALLTKWKRVVLHDRAYGAVPVPPVQQQQTPMPASSSASGSGSASLPNPVLTTPSSTTAAVAPAAATVHPGSSAPSPVYTNGTYTENGFTFAHSNGFTTPSSMHPNPNQNQPAQQDGFMPYSTPEPASKRRRVSSTAGVGVSVSVPHTPDILANSQPPQQPSQQQQQQQLPPLPPFQQAATMPPPPPQPQPLLNDVAVRARKTPAGPQYRFKYSSGPNTPKASSLHSPPAQNSNFLPPPPPPPPPGPGPGSAQFYPAAAAAPAPAPPPPAPAPHTPQQPSAGIPQTQTQHMQSTPNVYNNHNNNSNIQRPYSANASEGQQPQSQPQPQHQPQPQPQAQTAPSPAPAPAPAPALASGGGSNFADINFDGASSSSSSAAPNPTPDGDRHSTGPNHDEADHDHDAQDADASTTSRPPPQPPQGRDEESTTLSHSAPMAHAMRKTDITS